MDTDKIIGIYKIININNKKVYIGSSNNIENRWKQHLYELKNNCHHSVKLQNSYNKTKDKSVFQFEIVEVVDDLSILHTREQYYIDLYDAYNKGYNCCSIVDNPKYSKQNLRNAHKKEELKILYDKLENLIIKNENIISFGIKTKFKIEHKEFKNKVCTNIITAIEWFVKNYDICQYKACIYNNKKTYLTIEDLNGIKIKSCIF